VTCAEFKELAAALALDALDPDERARARAHLAEPIGHEGCAEALGRAEQAARLLPGALIDRPPPDRVWRWIEARLSARAPRRRWATVAGWVVAAAACVAAVLLAGRSARLRKELDAARGQTATTEARAGSSDDLARQCAAQLEAARKTSGLAREAVALLEQRGSRVVPFAPQPGFTGTAFAVIAPDRRRVILLSTALLPAAARDYQLWRGAGAGRPGPGGGGGCARRFPGQRPRPRRAGAGRLRGTEGRVAHRRADYGGARRSTQRLTATGCIFRARTTRPLLYSGGMRFHLILRSCRGSCHV